MANVRTARAARATFKAGGDIRQEFIAFFEGKGHRFVRSSPVVPQDDPTLLFTNAGMNQFKDIFLGKGSRDYTRAVNSQKCIRASGKHNDLEDVGRDNYHHTFFEMLGNWSFGDYFKREAIAWAWELLVERWGLDPQRMYATVFAGSPGDNLEPDLEAEALWSEVAPLPPERVLRFGKQDNFWEMGENGPCGPCSEMHYDLGEGTCPQGTAGRHTCGVNKEGCWRFIELWNLVFIQFNRHGDGSLETLPSKHVDTGMGLERIVRVLQGKHSNYDSDLFTPLLQAVSEVTGAKDGPGEAGVAFRVIADHLRSLTFAIADGALPSNEGRGYVLRRMLRRAARFGKVLGMDEPFIHRLVPALAESMGDAFPELRARADHAARVIKAEEESFAQTLDRGIERFDNVIKRLTPGYSTYVPGRGGEQLVQPIPQPGERLIFPGEEVFKLYDTYGFPVDLTRLMAEERGFDTDMEGFERLMEEQRAKGKAAGAFAEADGQWHTVSEGPHSQFVGYEQLEAQATVRSYRLSEAEGGTRRVLIVLDRTPFYAESGGQVGDQGTLGGEAGQWNVVDVQHDGDRIVHICEQAEPHRTAALPDARPLCAKVDAERRERTTLNHTATHLLHAALRQVLGSHVNQAGSVVHPDYLRFDFTHFEKPGDEQLETIEKRVNQVIRQNIPLNVYHTGFDEAVDAGIIALFGEKYGDRVRVVQVPEFSSELCGGCHVRASGDIGIFKIVSESSIATGVRRIVALSGEAAEAHLRESSQLVERFRQMLNAPAEELSARLEQLLDNRRRLERELRSARKGDLAQGAADLLKRATRVRGVNILASEVEAASMNDLRALADELRRKMEHGVAVIGSVINGKASLVCVVSDDLVRDNVKAGDIVNKVAEVADGRGGGPPHMATAGAKDVGKLPLAVQRAPVVIDSYLEQLTA
ncbi:MAG: alanine--tRNA ligase [SAR324 cluster bacterium]|nr:alanine--tRNA ligase [SAR324 cluster bacterium]